MKLQKPFLACVLLIGVASFADAGIIAQLDNASLTGAPGDTLIFSVTLTNPSSTDQIWLNGTGSTSVSPFLTIDTNPFNTNAPFFLDPMTGSGLFEFFHVIIDPNAPDGPYIGNVVSILGGADGGTGSAFDDLVDISFDVQVQAPASGVPEPGTFGMLSLVLLAACLMPRNKFQTRFLSLTPGQNKSPA